MFSLLAFRPVALDRFTAFAMTAVLADWCKITTGWRDVATQQHGVSNRTTASLRGAK